MSSVHYDPITATLSVVGEIGFANVVDLQAQGQQILLQQPVRKIDFSQVTHSNSAGLALLLAWYRVRGVTRDLSLTQMPASIIAIAHACRLTNVLPLPPLPATEV